jgi:membrane fusion protein, heavy metal efflux system
MAFLKRTTWRSRQDSIGIISNLRLENRRLGRLNLIFMLLCSIGFGLQFTACSNTRNESAAANQTASEPKPETPAETKAPVNQVQVSAEALKRGQIETAEATTHTLRQTLEAPGRLTFNEDQTVRAGTIVGGRVTRVLATVGDFVKKGQALVYLHSHELIDARGAQAKAKAAVTEKEKALAYAKAEAERAERLLEAKAGSKRDLAHAQANVNAAQGELEQARAELARASEFLEHLSVPHDSHDDIVIYSPINGFVTKRNVSIGAVVTEATDLMMVADLSTLWAIASVPERQAASVRIGQQVEAKITAFPEGRFTGRVLFLGNELDPQTRTVQVRCLINNPRGQLRPEMSATIKLDASKFEGGATMVLAIPRDAVQEVGGERVVFLALGEGKFEKLIVQTGREQDGLLEILSGLQSGQRIVTRGAFFIKSEFLKGSLAEE